MDKFYFGYFTCFENVVDAFAISDRDVSYIEIIYACYNQGDYSGDAHVIFIENNKLYEVNGSHCSCYGLEGQWSPEETTVQALMFRPNVDKDAKANLKKRFANLMCFL